MTPRAVGYMRVSTDDQSVDLQRTAIKRYARRRGWKLVGLYEDVGVSGLRGRRPQLDRLMAAARRKRFDAVIVWKFDRFARDTRDLLASLETFQTLGIDFVSDTEGIDTSTAMGEMVMTFLGAIAQFEAALIRERVRAGVRAKIATGARWGRRPTLGPVVVERARTLLEPLNLWEARGVPVAELSYGDQRQLEIALALATQPRILLLDEPTAGLSPAETQHVLRIIRGLPREITILLIEHDMAVVFGVCERIVVLHQGEVVAAGAPDAVARDARVQEIYLGVRT